MRRKRVPILAVCAILLLLSGVRPIRPLSAREIPDVLGCPNADAASEPRKGEQNPPARREALRCEAQRQPRVDPPGAATAREFLPGAMRKSLFLPDRKGYWIARWIDPSGEESRPIPLWIDRAGNGHLLLKATLVLGEDRPLLIRAPRIVACQVLSLFREPEGAFSAVASDVWIQLPRQAGETESLPTGKGRWRSAAVLTEARNVFSPFTPALREAEDPRIRGFASFRWPDVALVHLPGSPPLVDEMDETASGGLGTE